MINTLRNAFKVKDIRKRLFYTLIALVIVRLGTLLPAPAISRDYTAQLFDTAQLGFFNALTGGSLARMSIFALSISPYISASIIVQLLTIAIPKLEELQKDGEDGKKKINELTRIVTVGLAVLESAAMAIGFGASGGLEGGASFTNVVLIVASFTAGSAFLMWLGEKITQNGIGNGISIILLINIISTMPGDFVTLFRQFVAGQPVFKGILSSIIIILVCVITIVLVILLQQAQRKIPVQYAKKVQGRKMVGGQTSHIPLKVNTSGVIPVIFANSIMTFPVVILSFLNIQPAREHFWPKVAKVLSQDSWLRLKDFEWGEFKYSFGLLIYIALLMFFAYFYTSITFNPIEVADNIKKQGGFIPGIRPGKPTTEYLSKVLNYIIFIGATGLLIVSIIPMFFSGAFDARVTFGGTSIIIIVGVIVETINQVESQLLVRHYKGFLND